MKTKALAACSGLLYLVCSAAFTLAQSVDDKPAEAPKPIPLTYQSLVSAHILSAKPQFRQLYNGEAAGSMVLATEYEGENLVITDFTSVDRFHIAESMRCLLDAKTFALKSVDGTGRFGEDPMKIELAWEGDHVKGHSTFPRSEKDKGDKLVDQTLPPGTFERTALFALFHALPLKEGETYTVNQYSTFDLRVQERTITVEGREQVTVPAGTFDAVKVILKGVPLTQVFYIATDPVRKTVKIEVSGTPWSVELLP